MAKITYKEVPIKAVSDDGTLLKGVIYYWAKDYGVRLVEPVKVEEYGSHMMYMIPASFIVDENKEAYFVENGKHYVNVYSNGIKTLKQLYENHTPKNSIKLNLR